MTSFDEVVVITPRTPEEESAYLNLVDQVFDGDYEGY